MADPLGRLTYTEADIRAAVGQNAFGAGRVYQAQGRVLTIQHADIGAITASVRGSERRPYTQIIDVHRTAAGRVGLDGDCSCPVGFNCKHVAAALIHGLKTGLAGNRTGGQAPRPAPPPISAPPPARSSPPRFPSDLAAWLDGLDRVQATASEDYPETIAHRLVYVLAPMAREPRTAQLGVTPMSTRLLKDGRFSEAGRVYAGEGAWGAPAAQFLRPSDLRILDALGRLKREAATSGAVLFRASAAPVLADILATGRARWLMVNGPALAAGDARSASVEWRSRDGTALRPVLDCGNGVTVLNATPPLYVDPAAGLVGALDTGLAPALAASLLDAPPVPVGQLAAFNAALVGRAPGLAAARPPEPTATEVIEDSPQPCLRLGVATLPIAAPIRLAHGGVSGYRLGSERVALARLSFRYGPVTVPAGEAAARTARLHEGRLIEVRRDPAAERAHAESLRTLGFVPAATLRPGTPADHARDLLLDGDEMDWLDVLYQDLPPLAARGWRVEVADDFPFRLVRADGPFAAEVHEGSGIDWFELGLGVLIDGERVDLIEPIVALLGAPGFDLAALRAEEADDEPLYVPLADGRVLGVPAARLLPIVEAIAALAMGGSVGDGRLRLAAPDVAGLSALEAADASLVWQGGDRLREMGRRLGPAGGIPAVAAPDTFRATLRPYQAEGLSWLAFLREAGFGGVLADDMGLGKTVQALALVALEKAAGRLDRPALVIAPTSLVSNWLWEAERFAPDLRVLVLHGLDRRTRFDHVAASDLVLTTYPLIARDHATLSRTAWHLLILDEAQTVKNPNAATTKLIADLEARHRFGLTGTPVENHLGELWSLFTIVLPGFLGDRQAFGRQWRTPIEAGDSARGKLLARRVRPFMLRRTKEEVARDLPPKTEVVERIDLGRKQRDIYESIRLSMHERVRDAVARQGFARSRIVILDALLKLRQACCDPRLLKLDTRASAGAGSAKLDRLMEMVTDLHAEGRRILLFSQFTSMLDLIRPHLDEARIDYGLLTGRTRDRAAVVKRFQEGAVPLFLVSLKAGGTGLNLTGADTVILYDPWWNPAVEAQAIDRAHRIGQDKPVFVHKLVASGTIEEKMEVMKDRKRALAESLFDADGAPTLAMTEADLDALLS